MKLLLLEFHFMSLELLAMLIPVAIVVILMKYWLHMTISWWEAGAQLVAALVIVGFTYQAGINAKMRDHQFLNGVVTEKKKERVACEHSYQCNCRSDSDGGTSCDTCYEHLNDWDWNVYTNAGTKPDNQFTIARVDRRGSRTPPRWTQVQIGEPVALRREFDNYILGAPDSLFHRIAAERQLPSYPTAFDYMRTNRVISDGVVVPDLPLWNTRLTEILSVLGPQKQSNVVIVFTNSPSDSYAEDLRNRWLGGKKNDTIVVIGSPSYPEIQWVGVFSWSRSDMLNVSLRNDILEMGTVDREALLGVIQSNVAEHFVRRSMSEYEYLRSEITPTPGFLIIGWLLAILAPLMIGFYFHARNDGGGLREFNNRPRRFRL
jgi:hypothetical protein